MNRIIPRHALCGLILSLPSLTLPVSAEILVDLDATGAATGPLATWVNSGSVAGDFTATGAPVVEEIAGVNAVTLSGGADFFTGPIAPSSVTGINPSRTIEAWVFNPAIVGEETVFAWGRRGGDAGTNLAFNYGNNGNFGAVGHWGAPDLGWDNGGGAPTAGIWHHIVYTYDGGGAEGAGTTRVYADGVLQNSEALGTLNTHDGHAFVVGGQNNPDGNPAGFNSGLSIAKIRVHDVALSDAEIATQFEAEKSAFFPNAFLSASGIESSNGFFFEITDLEAPESVTNPDSFEVEVVVPAAGWSAQGAGGVINGSITSPEIEVTSDDAVELTLTHRYNFEGDGTPENVWDGGVVQFSINDGAFNTLAGENFSENGYFGSPIVGNGILNGVDGFNGKSAGFDELMTIDSVATIPGVSNGDKIRIRVLGAWDDAVTPDGLDWVINGVAVKAGETSLLDEDFSGGDGGFTAEQTDPGAAFLFGDGSSPASGDVVASKVDGVLRLTLPLTWSAPRDYTFNITGKDTDDRDLSYSVIITTPTLTLGDSLEWLDNIPGPLGEDGSWGVRTYLNFGIDGSTTLPEVLTFLKDNFDTRTPDLTPDTVIDTQESDLNFVDPTSNSAGNLWGVIPCSRPFPGDALSTSTNGEVARGDDNVITSAHGTISITEPGDYTFSIRGDDGFMFRIESPNGDHPEFIAIDGLGVVDRNNLNIAYFQNGTGDTNTRAIVTLKPGLYNLDYITWEGGGGFWYQVAAAKGFFPKSEDTDTWGAIGYVSAGGGATPYPAIIGDWTVQSSAPGVTVGNLSAASDSVDAAVAEDAAAATSTWPQINFTDPGFGGTGRIPGDVPWPRDVEGVDDDNYAMKMSATISIPEDGEYIFGFQGDDGSSLTIGGNNAGFIEVVENATGATTLGKGNTIAKNTGSLGDTADFNSTTSAQFEQDGALAGSDDSALAVGLNEPERPSVPLVPALNPADAFSAEIWLYPTEVLPDRNFYSALASGNFGDPRSGWLIYMDTNAGWNFRGYRNVGFESAWDVTGGGIPELNQWYHIVATWDGDTAKIYVNGVLDEGAQVSGITDFVHATEALTDGGLRVGSRSDNAFSWAGSADELAIYPTALDAETIQAHYENGLDADRAKPYPDLVAESNPLGYWRFNEETQPLVELNTLIADVPTGNSSSAGRIFLAKGEYPISATFWEAAGGSYFEIFASGASDTGCAPLQSLRTGGWPAVIDNSGLELVRHTDSVQLAIVGGIRISETGGLSLDFNSVPGESYTLLFSEDLINWVELDDNIDAETNLTTVQNVPGFVYEEDMPKLFYRIELNE